MIKAFGVSIVLLLAAAPASAEEESASVRFDQLKKLEGDWAAQTSDGRERHISYRVIARGSVLVERWLGAGDRETMTVFHMDGGRLLATHYCGQGSQPRFTFASSPSQGRMDFVFLDVTNLPEPAQSHQHAFSIEVDPSGRVVRSETYRSGGQDETETLVFTRLSASN